MPSAPGVRPEVPLGLVIGLMLDPLVTLRSVHAVVSRHEGDGQPVTTEVVTRGVDRYRITGQGRTLVADGQVVREYRGSTLVQALPQRLGHPPLVAQLLFPLRAPVWGRPHSDDYYMAGAAPSEGERRDEEALAGVVLRHMERDTVGHLTVGLTTGLIYELVMELSRWTLDEVVVGPVEDEVFERRRRGRPRPRPADPPGTVRFAY